MQLQRSVISRLTLKARWNFMKLCIITMAINRDSIVNITKSILKSKID